MMRMIRKFVIKATWLEIPCLILLTIFWVFNRHVLYLSFLILPLFWLGWFIKSNHFFPTTYLDTPLLFLAFWTLGSLFITPDIEHSAGKVLGVVLGISYYYAFIRISTLITSSDRDDKPISKDVTSRWVAIIIFIIGCGTAILGLLGAEWFQKYAILTKAADYIPRIIPPLPGANSGFQPNAISGTLTLFSPLIVLTIWELFFAPQKLVLINPIKPWFQNILLFLFALPLGLWWILAQTRGAWLGLGTGLVFLFIMVFNPRYKVGAWLFPLIPVIFLYGYWFQTERLDAGVIDLNTMSGANLTESLQFRVQVWEWASDVLKDFPFSGLGFNIFRKAAPMLYFGPDLGDVAHAHNIWLDIGATLGYGGVIIYIALWIVNGFVLWRTWNVFREHWRGKTALGLLAGWYAYFIFGLADTIPVGSKFGLAIFLSMAMGQIIVKNVELE